MFSVGRYISYLGIGFFYAILCISAFHGIKTAISTFPNQMCIVMSQRLSLMREDDSEKQGEIENPVPNRKVFETQPDLEHAHCIKHMSTKVAKNVDNGPYGCE